MPGSDRNKRSIHHGSDTKKTLAPTSSGRTIVSSVATNRSRAGISGIRNKTRQGHDKSASVIDHDCPSQARLVRLPSPLLNRWWYLVQGVVPCGLMPEACVNHNLPANAVSLSPEMRLY